MSLPLTCLGQENVEQRCDVWLASVRFQKPPVPLASGLGCSDNLVGPISSRETCPPSPNLQGEAALGDPELLGVASLLRLCNSFLSNWEKKNIAGFLFASVLTHPWLLGLFNWLETMAGAVSPRVKSLCWACVSFWSRTHFLPASLSSCPHLGFVTNLA